MLSELDNIDKHRLLLVADPKFADANVQLVIGGVVKSVGRLSQVIPDWAPLKQGTVFFRLSHRDPVPGGDATEIGTARSKRTSSRTSPRASSS
jgi:hypothetical protein